MHQLLIPAVRLTGRMRYSAKFALILALFILPLGIVFYYFQSTINDTINFARNERQGVTYDRPVTKLLRDVLVRERFSYGRAIGSGSSDSQVAAIDQNIQADIAAVDTADKD